MSSMKILLYVATGERSSLEKQAMKRMLYNCNQVNRAIGLINKKRIRKIFMRGHRGALNDTETRQGALGESRRQVFLRGGGRQRGCGLN